MKARRSLLLFLTLVLVFVGAGGLWVWKAKQQYALNRQLIAALKNNDTKQALALVNRGADPNTRYTPPPAPTLKLLLTQLLHRSSVPVNNSPTAFVMACGGDWSLMYSDIVFESNPSEDVRLVQAMLAHGADCNIICEKDTTALLCATESNYLNVAQLLLEHGANVNAQDYIHRTPLMFSARKPDTALTRLLLEHGAHVSLEDKWGQSALHWALVTPPNRDMVRLLLAHGADPNHPDKDGLTPIEEAQKVGRPDLVPLLRGKR